MCFTPLRATLPQGRLQASAPLKKNNLQAWPVVPCISPGMLPAAGLLADPCAAPPWPLAGPQAPFIIPACSPYVLEWPLEEPTLPRWHDIGYERLKKRNGRHVSTVTLKWEACQHCHLEMGGMLSLSPCPYYCCSCASSPVPPTSSFSPSCTTYHCRHPPCTMAYHCRRPSSVHPWSSPRLWPCKSGCIPAAL